MSYKEKLYENALKLCGEIYLESQYNKDVDLYRSYDIINATNPAQVSSKEWLVEHLSSVLKDDNNLRDGKIRDVLIMGAWYGITGGLLRQEIGEECKIWNIDSDPECQRIGYKLQNNIENLQNNIFATEDAIDYYFERTDAFQLIINTSCEHMEKEDIDMILSIKPPNTIICFQSNNMHEEPEHINTHENLESFVDSLNLVKVFWSGTYVPRESTYERYMVIGI